MLAEPGPRMKLGYNFDYANILLIAFDLNYK